MRITLLFIYFSFIPLILLSQEEKEWKLVKQQRGIDVYVKSVPESPVNAVKASVVVDCSISIAYAVVVDAKNHPLWMYQCKQAKILNKISDTSWYYYGQSKTPWPVADRDFASYTYVSKNGENSIIVIGKGVPDYVPQRDGYIRLPFAFSEWKLTSLASGKTYAELFLTVDVGGIVPPWLLNLFISRGPYQTLYNFSRVVHNKKYCHAKLPAFLTE